MNYLLDTHTFLWYIDGDEQLPPKVRNVISNHNIIKYLSIASPFFLMFRKASRSKNKSLSMK